MASCIDSLVHKSLWKTVSLIVISIWFVSCTTYQKALREPAADHAEEAAAEAAFRVNLLPSSFRKEFVLNSADVESFRNAKNLCADTEFADLAKRPESEDAQSSKISILIAKLSRPFYYVHIPNRSGGVHFVGRFEDLKELTCISFALRDGQEEFTSETAGRIPTVIQKVASQREISFVNLERLLQMWGNSGFDIESGKTIFAHPHFDFYGAKEAVKTLSTTTTLAPATSVGVIEALTKSKVYKENSVALSGLLMGEFTQRISAPERYSIANLLARNPSAIENSTLLNFTFSRHEVGADYEVIYRRLTHGRSIDEQFKVLSTALRSGSMIQGQDERFNALWKSRSGLSLTEKMGNFALSDVTRNRWLTKDTVRRVAIEWMTGEHSDSSAVDVLELCRDESAFTFSECASFLKLLAAKAPEPVAVKIYQIAIGYNTSNPSMGSSLAPLVHKLTIDNRESESHVIWYLRYLNGIDDKRTKQSMANDLMSRVSIDEVKILNIAQATFVRGDAASYRFVKTALQQPKLTSDGLDYFIGLVASRQLTDDQRSILKSILVHPKANAKTKTKADDALNPERIKYVVEPKPL